MSPTAKKAQLKAVRRAVDLAGGATKVAEAFGISPQAVSKWPWCPSKRVLKLEALTGSRVTRYELRADMYGTRPEKAA